MQAVFQIIDTDVIFEREFLWAWLGKTGENDAHHKAAAMGQM